MSSSLLRGILTSFFLVGYAYSQTLVIVKQSSDEIHNVIVEGFRSYPNLPRDIEILEKDAEGSVDMAKKIINESLRKKRDIHVFAIGVIPMYAARELLSDRANNPVIFTLVFSPERMGKIPKNFCGVLLRPDPTEAITRFREQLGESEIFVPFSEASELAADELKLAGRKMGIKVLTKRLRTDPEVIEFLQNYGRNPLWLLPDPLLVNPDTIPYILDISSRADVIVFSKWLVRSGASMGYEIDFFEVGRKASEVFVKILEGKVDIRKEKFFYPPVRYVRRGEI